MGAYRRAWRARLASALHRFRFPHSRPMTTAIPEDLPHPWRAGGRWVERRVLAPWFSASSADRVQWREYQPEYVVCDVASDGGARDPGREGAETPARAHTPRLAGLA